MKICLLKVVLLFLFLASCQAHAFWFGEEKTTEEVLHRSLEPEEVSKYKNVFDIFEQRQQEFIVFERVLKEKQDEVDEYNNLLQTQYGVVATRSYSYNPTNLTVTVVFQDAAGKTKSLPHRIFVTKEEGDQFLSIALAKQIASQQMELIDALYEEKSTEFKHIQQVLLSTFGMKPEKKYRFDEKARKIYEIRKLKTKAEIKAEKEAVRKSIAAAEKKAEELKKQKKAEAAKARAEAAKAKAAAKAKQEELERKEKQLNSKVEYLEDSLSDSQKKLKRYSSARDDRKEDLKSLEEKLEKLRKRKSKFEKETKIIKEISEVKKEISSYEKLCLNEEKTIKDIEQKIKIAKKDVLDFKASTKAKKTK